MGFKNYQKLLTEKDCALFVIASAEILQWELKRDESISFAMASNQAQGLRNENKIVYWAIVNDRGEVIEWSNNSPPLETLYPLLPHLSIEDGRVTLSATNLQDFTS